ncbi:hypothetical protein B0H10DRAFT_1956763 [Mycena sp. CBHHK59/15]|nr:hypothetical protein B0H10DRAFT_1956763 [Mycena sp. CBHHK59/15]
MPAVNSKTQCANEHFMPYARPKVLESLLHELRCRDPSPADLSRLQAELQFRNNAGTETWTYCNILKGWKPWFHPRISKNGSCRLLSPSHLSFRNLKPEDAPQCPHSQNPYRETKDTVMKLCWVEGGGWQFQCSSHVCPFIVQIARWDDRLIINKAQFNECHERMHAEEVEDNSDASTDCPSSSPTRSSDKVASLLQGSSRSSSMNSIQSSGSNSSLTLSRPYLFTQAEADKRDYNWEEHPATPGRPLPSIMHCYLEPEFISRANQYNDFFDTITGHAVWILNSNIGCCTNTPRLDDIPAWNLPASFVVQFEDRDYPAGAKPPTPIEFFDTSFSVAWSEWNSRIGVPEDVWAIFSTAHQMCRDCGLIRTFEADQAHRDKNNMCMDLSKDVGQGGVGRIDNGTGTSSYKVKAPEGHLVLYGGAKGGSNDHVHVKTSVLASAECPTPSNAACAWFSHYSARPCSHAQATLKANPTRRGRAPPPPFVRNWSGRGNRSMRWCSSADARRSMSTEVGICTSDEGVDNTAFMDVRRRGYVGGEKSGGVVEGPESKAWWRRGAGADEAEDADAEDAEDAEDVEGDCEMAGSLCRGSGGWAGASGDDASGDGSGYGGRGCVLSSQGARTLDKC